MNKDLAAVSAVWRALFGVRGAPLILLVRLLVVHFSKSRRRCFCGGFWVRLWRRAQFSMVHSREFSHDRDSVSVMAVQEKCAEKVWKLPSGTGVSGVGSSEGPLLEKRQRRGAPRHPAPLHGGVRSSNHDRG